MIAGGKKPENKEHMSQAEVGRKAFLKTILGNGMQARHEVVNRLWQSDRKAEKKSIKGRQSQAGRQAGGYKDVQRRLMA